MPVIMEIIRVTFLCKKTTTKTLSRCNSRYKYNRTPVYNGWRKIRIYRTPVWKVAVYML